MDDAKKTTCKCNSCSQIFVDITRGFLMFCLSILVLVTALSKPSDSTLALIRAGFEVAARSVSLDVKNITPSNETTKSQAQLIDEQNKKFQEVNMRLLQLEIQVNNLTAKHKS